VVVTKKYKKTKTQNKEEKTKQFKKCVVFSVELMVRGFSVFSAL